MSTRPQLAVSNEFPDELPKQHEIVCGILVRKAVPSLSHCFVQRRLATFVDPFHGRRSTPGGWWIGTECDIQLFPKPDEQRYQPDLAGWRIAVMPQPAMRGRVREWPQWVCEILSPDSTASRDKGVKLDTYHRAHVDHYWLIEPDEQSLTVLAWAEGRYETIVTAGRGDRVRAEPFAERELDLDWLFDFD